VSELDLSTAFWRKSSHSGAQGGDCIEVAELSGIIAIRDSKNPDSCTLNLDYAAFSRFARTLRAA
jgi:hypothetical protein